MAALHDHDRTPRPPKRRGMVDAAVRLLVACFGLAATLSAQASAGAPAGYRFPVEADYSGDWALFRTTHPEPFVTRADFNADGVPDEAWLLPATTAPGWGLFMFLGSPSGTPEVMQLERIENTAVQGYGVASVQPGTHRTACGKGYWTCLPNEPEVLRLDGPALELFMFEGPRSIFWWDSRVARFKRTWMSD